VYHTGDLPPKDKLNKWAAEMTPIKLGDGVYLCTATNNLAKLDPVTGKAIWTHDVGTQYKSVPYTAACRGLAHYVSAAVPAGSPCHEKIIEGTIDGRLIAVDAATGKSCENFGTHGEVSLLKGLGETVPGFVAMTSPPVLVKGTVVVNHEVLDGQRRWAPSGAIRGFDADTGAFKWAWDVNRPGQRGEPGPGEQFSRGTPNSWGPMQKALDMIGELYSVEADIRGKYPCQRLRVRLEKTKPLLASIERWMKDKLATLSAKSETAKAIRYSLNQWDALM
jgi:quinoprotein glucose dehydrogenase